MADKRADKRPKKLTHLDARGHARMVDVGDKSVTAREAVARGVVRMQPATLEVLLTGGSKKGDVLAVARIAGIQASKRTPELIPLCHGIALHACEVLFEPDPAQSLVRIEARARAHDRTGVEMEALTAVSVAALTIYDMLKAIDRSMTIDEIALHEKRGGKSGDFLRT
ncbi:MAG TPA: cyclic pyranopterin monophosphate synthase MoaC [Polyangiales bacterium]|jgi:cyclic pyranopterin phosphate synthase|nr:cyclic pyranopterin monophosphate synthase MoaC [Polyangiales bacterium]